MRDQGVGPPSTPQLLSTKWEDADLSDMSGGYRSGPLPLVR
eukprot:SAG22_NODE_13220_length_414_cov_0.806349_1_plen_41_part_10